MSEAKIKIQELDLYYGSFQALKNIQMELPQKQITAFIGPSGCGKSTLLKSINRMNDLIDAKLLEKFSWTGKLSTIKKPMFSI